MRLEFKVAIVAMAIVCMAPSRRTELDHVGAYNFMVEISGVEAGYFKGVDGLTEVFESSGSQETARSEIRLRAGRLLYKVTRDAEVDVRIHVIIERPTMGLPPGRVCSISLPARVVDARRTGLRLRPSGPATDTCDVLRQ